MYQTDNMKGDTEKEKEEASEKMLEGPSQYF